MKFRRNRTQRLQHISSRRWFQGQAPAKLTFRSYEPNISSRLHALVVGLLCFSGLICLRLSDLQRDEHSKWLKIAAKQHQGSIQVQGVRGTIYDAAGRTLAASVRAVSLGVHPSEIGDIHEMAEKLAPYLDSRVKEVEEKLQTDKSFVWLARGLPLTVGEDINKLGLSGLRQISEFRRYYPQGQLAGAVLGRISRDGQGLAGIELALEQELKAPNVKLAVRRDARGRLLTATSIQDSNDSLSKFLTEIPERTTSLLPALFGDEKTAPEDIEIRKEGSEIVLTLDSISQRILEEELARGAAETKAARVFSVVMDAGTGEILALSQTPMFDPNKFENIAPNDLRNSVIQDSFEPGSTIKPLVAAIALEQGVVKENEFINCEGGEYRVGPHIVRDVHPQGMLNLRDILVRSSNICMAKIGQRLGTEHLYSALLDYGFGKATQLELPGEANGILRNAKNWAEIDIATHAFGQGVSVTAMQMVQAYGALANGGRLVQPTLIKRQPEDEIPSKRILSPATVQKINAMLRGVTEDEHGTGQKAKIPGITVYGKTGTAQKAREGGRGYDNNKILGSFVGFTEGRQIGLNRNLVMLVAVDEPGVMPRWGGTVAAPIFQRAMSRILSHLLAVELRNAQSASNGSNNGNVS